MVQILVNSFVRSIVHFNFTGNYKATGMCVCVLVCVSACVRLRVRPQDGNIPVHPLPASFMQQFSAWTKTISDR